MSCVNREEEEQQLALAVACKQLSSSSSCCFLSCTYSSETFLGLTCAFVRLKGCWGCLRLEHNLHLTWPCQKVSELHLALQLQDLLHRHFTPIVFLLCIKCNSCIECAPKSAGPQLCQKLYYSISSPLTGSTACLMREQPFHNCPWPCYVGALMLYRRWFGISSLQ